MKNGWKIAPMGTLCSIKSGESNSVDSDETGPYAFFDRSKKIKRSTRYLYDCEALIIPGEGAEFLPRHFIGKFDLHQRAYALFDFSKDLDVRYLFYYLTYFKDYFVRVAVGATVKSLRLRHFEQLPVPVPRLPEQRRIVGILDEAFEGIATAEANAEKNLQNARAIFESHLQSVFTQRGEGWKEKLLGDICEVKDGTHSSPKYVANGIPFVTQKNIREEGLSFVKTKLISEEDHRDFYRRSNVARGDILISMIGANRGMACIVDDDRTFSIKNVGLVKRSEAVNQQFLLYFLKSRQAADYVRTASKGGAQEFVGLTELRAFPIPFAPLNCQDQLAAKFQILREETQRLATVYEHKLTALEALKKSLLHQAFSGELTAQAEQLLEEGAA